MATAVNPCFRCGETLPTGWLFRFCSQCRDGGVVLPSFGLKDSGQREQFSTGSQRDSRDGKGRFDLVPTQELRRLAKVYELGAVKYNDNNWRKGQPLRRYIDSAMRHLLSAAEGMDDEDHIMQAAWNCFAFAFTQRLVREGRLPPELNDLYPELPPADRTV